MLLICLNREQLALVLTRVRVGKEKATQVTKSIQFRFRSLTIGCLADASVHSSAQVRRWAIKAYNLYRSRATSALASRAGGREEMLLVNCFPGDKLVVSFFLYKKRKMPGNRSKCTGRYKKPQNGLIKYCVYTTILKLHWIFLATNSDVKCLWNAGSNAHRPIDKPSSCEWSKTGLTGRQPINGQGRVILPRLLNCEPVKLP